MQDKNRWFSQKNRLFNDHHRLFQEYSVFRESELKLVFNLIYTMKQKSYIIALIFLLAGSFRLLGFNTLVTSGDWEWEIVSAGTGNSWAVITRYNGSGANINVPSSFDVLDSIFAVKGIGDEAFKDCISVKTVVIPSSVEQIGLRAFYGCTSLTGITIPEKVTKIPEGCFFGCSSLLLVFLPDGVSSIDSVAFKKCTSIRGISLPAKLKTIGSQAFQFCSSLAKITIPDTVTSIDSWAFASCANLTKATFEGNAPSTFGSSVFAGVSPAFSIYYNKGYAGWTTPTWNRYLTTMIVPDISPSITSQPSSQTVQVGQSVTFSVSATGTAPLRYQWYTTGGATVSNATGSSFTIPSVDGSWAGGYFCRVSNGVGSVDSAVAMLTVTSAASNTPSVRVPLYRFSRNDNPSHFFTAVEEEKNIVLSELGDYFSLQGVSHYVLAGQVSNAWPVYRMYNSLSGAHFYTASAVERDNVLATMDYFSLEGIAFFVFLYPEPGTLPVYRFYVPQTGSHFFTISEAEKNLLISSGQTIKNYEGVAWYAYPSDL